MEIATEEQQAKINRLQAIKEEHKALSVESKKIEDSLPTALAYRNEDGTWTRYTRIDNLVELQEKGEIFRAAPISRFSTKLETLKNKPKELA